MVQSPISKCRSSAKVNFKPSIRTKLQAQKCRPLGRADILHPPRFTSRRLRYSRKETLNSRPCKSSIKAPRSSTEKERRLIESLTAQTASLSPKIQRNEACHRWTYWKMKPNRMRYWHSRGRCLSRSSRRDSKRLSYKGRLQSPSRLWDSQIRISS